MSSVTPLPTAPSRRLRPSTFLSDADAWDAALQVFAAEVALYGAEIASAVDTVNAALAASLWANTGATYAIGDRRYSPANGLLYRRLTASNAGTTDPSVDTTNWALVSPAAPPLTTNNTAAFTATKNAHNESSYTAGAVTVTFPATPSVGDWFWLGFQNSRTDNVLNSNGSKFMNQVAGSYTTGTIYHGGLWRYVSASFGWRLMQW